MGFLDFLDEHGKGVLEFIDKHRTPEKSLEEYIMERTADQIYRAGLKCISSGLRGEPSSDDVSKCYGLYYLLHSWAGSLNYPQYHFVDSKLNQKPIPNAYKNEWVSAIDLLEKSTAKGHADAPFVLALLNEHGLTSEKVIWAIEGSRPPRLTYPNTLIFRDQDKADSYHYIAKDRGSPFEEAYQYIKENCKVRDGFKVDAGENVVMQMTQDRDVEKMLGKRADEFKAIGGKLVLFYALMETPFSMAYAATSLKLMYDGEDIEYFSDFQYRSNEDKIRAASALQKRLVRMARSGDENAVFALNHWYKNIDFSGVN